MDAYQNLVGSIIVFKATDKKEYMVSKDLARELLHLSNIITILYHDYNLWKSKYNIDLEHFFDIQEEFTITCHNALVHEKSKG